MALQKSITLPNSAAGNYIRLTFYRHDAIARELSAHFMLYASAAARIAAPTEPLTMVAKLRLSGAKFDQYLSTAALTALSNVGPDRVAAAVYVAAKAETLIAGGGLTVLDLSAATDV